jgi:hypothetical protein
MIASNPRDREGCNSTCTEPCTNVCTTTVSSSSVKEEQEEREKPSRGRTSTPPVFSCKNMEGVKIKRQQEDVPDLVEVLSMITEEMR